MFLGVPSIFVRTSGCNLRCSWCDTPYTSWKPEKNLMDIGFILDEIESYGNCRHIVVTGGEPLIQKDIVELVDELKRRNKFVTIETNGTVFAPVDADLFSISPKLRNSNPKGKWMVLHDEKRINVPVLKRLLQFVNDADKLYQLKFVVEGDNDMNEIQKLVEDLSSAGIKIRNESIVLMPQARTKEELEKGYLTVIELAKAYGYRMTPRFHIDVWGSKRGV